MEKERIFRGYDTRYDELYLETRESENLLYKGGYNIEYESQTYGQGRITTQGRIRVDEKEYTFKGKCNICGRYGHKASQCSRNSIIIFL